MTKARQPLGDLPNWPRWLREDQAAAYVGHGVGLFLQGVAAGLWPAPRRFGAGLRRIKLWDRVAIDQASDRLSNPSPDDEKRQLLRRAKGDETVADSVP